MTMNEVKSVAFGPTGLIFPPSISDRLHTLDVQMFFWTLLQRRAEIKPTNPSVFSTVDLLALWLCLNISVRIVKIVTLGLF